MPDATVETVEETEATPVEPEVVEEPKAELDAEPKAEEPPESSTEKKNGFQKRIDELTHSRREAERERDYWREQVTKQIQPAETKPEPVKTLEDFDFDEAKYHAYTLEQIKKEAVNEAKQVIEQERQIQAKESKASEFSRLEAEYAKEHKDYYEVTRSQSLPYTEEMNDVVTTIQNGPEVLHYLANNVDVSDRIARMDDINQAVELGRISERLNQAKISKQESVTNAPAPPPKLKGSTNTQPISSASPDSDKLSTEEWLKRERKRIANRGF